MQPNNKQLLARLPALLTFLLAALWFQPTASASGLVQVTLSGNLDKDGGSRVEFRCQAAGKELSFRGHLARDTRVGDLAVLLQRRLKRAGIEVVAGPDSPPRGPYSFFIEDCEMVALRLGAGLEGRLTAVEEAPSSLRVSPPRAARERASGDLRVFLSTVSPIKEREEVFELNLALPDLPQSSAWVAEHLATLATSRGWKTSRPAPDAFASTGMTSGALAVGMSVELFSYSDWELELRFPTGVTPR